MKNIKISKSQDHRIINKKMNLFHFQDHSAGMVFWHHNGWIIFRELKNFIRFQLKKWDYKEVSTPIIMSKSIWETSGHMDNFSDSIFFINSENREYCIKPMNCPAHIKIFNHSLKSYRQLPFRISEFGICHRNETSGSMHGLMRLKKFTQDDAHIFCTEKQIQFEIKNCIKMIFDIYKIFGFKKVYVKFSTRPKKSIGNDKIWHQAELSLKNALLDSNISFQYKEGEGAFYGPKIEFILEDSLNRFWQCGTIQLDFYLPKRFNIFYIDNLNERKTPVMIHRAILGSIERFIGILIEEYSGFLPVWLSPIQVVIINVGDNHIKYVLQITKKIYSYGIRVKSDIRKEKINFKIRKYTIKRVPYILICGGKEIKSNTVSVRNNIKNTVESLDFNIFIKNIIVEIKNYIFSKLEE